MDASVAAEGARGVELDHGRSSSLRRLSMSFKRTTSAYSFWSSGVRRPVLFSASSSTRGAKSLLMASSAASSCSNVCFSIRFSVAGTCGSMPPICGRQQAAARSGPAQAIVTLAPDRPPPTSVRGGGAQSGAFENVEAGLTMSTVRPMVLGSVRRSRSGSFSFQPTSGISRAGSRCRVPASAACRVGGVSLD